MTNNKSVILKILIAIIIIVLVSFLIYINQTPVFLTKAIKLFNKNYEYKTPTVEIQNLDNTFIAPLKDGKFAFATQEQTEVLSPSLKNETTVSLSGEAPTVKSNGDKFILFHKNSNKAVLINGRKSLPITCQNNILTAAVNNNGYCVLVTEEKGFKSQVIVYSPDGKEMYKWHSADNYITDIDYSPSDNCFAASIINYADSKLTSSILIFTTDKEQPEEISIDDLAIEIKFLDKSKIAVISKNGIKAISTSKKVLWTVDFGSKKLFSYVIKNSKIAVATGTLNLSTETSDISLYDSFGKNISTYKNKGEISTLDIFGNDILIAGKREIKVVNKEKKYDLKIGKDVHSAMFINNNKTALVVTNSLAQIMYLNQ